MTSDAAVATQFDRVRGSDHGAKAPLGKARHLLGQLERRLTVDGEAQEPGQESHLVVVPELFDQHLVGCWIVDVMHRAPHELDVVDRRHPLEGLLGQGYQAGIRLMTGKIREIEFQRHGPENGRAGRHKLNRIGQFGRD